MSIKNGSLEHYFKYLEIFTDTNFEKNYQQNPIGWLTPKKAANGERGTANAFFHLANGDQNLSRAYEYIVEES